MPTAATNVHYVLECRRGPHVHYIPIPRPSRLGTDANPPATATAGHKAIVACPECGLVSAYSESELQLQMSPRRDPFEAGECRLVFLRVECDDKTCDLPKAVHTVIGSGKGAWKEKVAPRDWEFDPECLCDKRHHLEPNWEENRFAWEVRHYLI